jgi:hypothetical protein
LIFLLLHSCVGFVLSPNTAMTVGHFPINVVASSYQKFLFVVFDQEGITS